MTGKDACEVISAWLEKEYNIKIKPEDIWKMSPTGELMHVGILYKLATERRD